MRRVLFLAGIAALALTANLSVHAAPASDAKFAISLDAHTLPLSSSDPKLNTLGRLRYRGGLEIDSSDSRFGGLSAMAISADGTQILAISDEAHWFRATLHYSAKGDLSGISDGALADMRALDGATLRGKQGDAEGMATVTPHGIDGEVLVSFEGDHRVWRYDLAKGLDAVPSAFPMPDAIKSLDSNKGLESFVALGGGKYLAIAETGQNTDGTHPAWLVGDGAPQTLRVTHHDPYEVTDGTIGPDGNLYLMERHYFGPLGGVVAAVREVPSAAIKPGAQLDGGEIAKFTMRQNIDNMEGIAMRLGPDDKTFVYLLADDNYSPIERTVLLMFELLPP